MSEQKKKNQSNGQQKPKKAEPWKKMYQGQKADEKNVPGKKAEGKKPEGKKKAQEFLDFLYLLPKRTSAKDLAKELSFIAKDHLEVWDAECVIEITTEGGTITFEDIRDTLEKEDEKVLSDLRMKQVIACDYEASDRKLVRQIMKVFLDRFGGKIGTDTEDFSPFHEPEDL